MSTLFEDEPQVMEPKRGRLCLSIHVPAIPVAQPRVKATTINGFARVYNPRGPVDVFKSTVAMSVSRAYQGKPLESPFSVSIVFVFPRPSSMMWKRKPMPRARHSTRPDRDNLDKAVLDAMKGLVFRDDAQVCAGSIEKWIAAGDEQAHVTIVIEELSE